LQIKTKKEKEGKDMLINAKNIREKLEFITLFFRAVGWAEESEEFEFDEWLNNFPFNIPFKIKKISDEVKIASKGRTKILTNRWQLLTLRAYFVAYDSKNEYVIGRYLSIVEYDVVNYLIDLYCKPRVERLSWDYPSVERLPASLMNNVIESPLVEKYKDLDLKKYIPMLSISFWPGIERVLNVAFNFNTSEETQLSPSPIIAFKVPLYSLGYDSKWDYSHHILQHVVERLLGDWKYASERASWAFLPNPTEKQVLEAMKDDILYLIENCYNYIKEKGKTLNIPFFLKRTLEKKEEEVKKKEKELEEKKREKEKIEKEIEELISYLNKQHFI
jgi:hypothetical protein